MEIAVDFLSVMQTSEKNEIFTISKKRRILETLYRQVDKSRRRSLTVCFYGGKMIKKREKIKMLFKCCLSKTSEEIS